MHREKVWMKRRYNLFLVYFPTGCNSFSVCKSLALKQKHNASICPLLLKMVKQKYKGYT